MKGLNKLALATAVAAAPFATQAMEPMSDSQMGNVTGQEGVTIELNTAMTIDQIEYSQDTNGSVLVDDVRVGGFTDGESLDLSLDIDLKDSGDAVISLGSLDGGPVELGVDAGVDYSGDGATDTQALGLDGDAGSATLISGLEMDMYLTQLDITAQVAEVDGNVPNDGSTGSLQIDTQFAIDNLDVDFDVAAVSLEGMRMAGDGSLEQMQPDDSGNVGAPVGSGALAQTPAIANMTIGAGEALGNDAQPNGGDVLRIKVDSFQADMWMPTIKVGGASIGSVGIDNLQVQQTDIAVYGRQ